MLHSVVTGYTVYVVKGSGDKIIAVVIEANTHRTALYNMSLLKSLVITQHMIFLFSLL